MDTKMMTNLQMRFLLETAMNDLQRRNTLALPPCESCGKPCKARPSAIVLSHCPRWMWRRDLKE